MKYLIQYGCAALFGFFSGAYAATNPWYYGIPMVGSSLIIVLAIYHLVENHFKKPSSND